MKHCELGGLDNTLLFSVLGAGGLRSLSGRVGALRAVRWLVQASGLTPGCGHLGILPFIKTTPRPLPSSPTAFPVYTSVSNLLLFVGMLLILD